MANPWNGFNIDIIGCTGPKESGKTVFGSTIMPEDTLMIDCELGSSSYRDSIPYKRRVDIFEELAKQKRDGMPTPIDAFLLWKKIVEDIKPGEFSVVVTDTYDFIQHGLHDWIESNPAMFGRTEAQYARASGLVWGDLKHWLHIFLGMLSKKLQGGSIVLICHEGAEWKDSKPTSKLKTKGVDTVYQLASLFLNFERKPDEKGKIARVPAAYTCSTHRGKSRLMHSKMEAGELVSVPILPPRLPEATPNAIRRYIAKPVDLTNFKKGELAPEVKMSEEDKLELKARIADDTRATEEMKLSRAELLAKAAQRANAVRKPAAVTKPTADTAPAKEEAAPAPASAAAPAPAPEPKQEPPKEGPKDTATTATQETPKDSESKQDASGALEAPFVATNEEKPKPVREVIAAQKAEMVGLGITEDQWKQILGKRKKADGSPCQTLEDLTDAQAEELRKSLWDWLTKNRSGKK